MFVDIPSFQSASSKRSYRFGQVLLGAEIIHRGLNRPVPEQQLDLFERAAGLRHSRAHVVKSAARRCGTGMQ